MRRERKIMRDGNARENVPENGWLNKKILLLYNKIRTAKMRGAV